MVALAADVRAALEPNEGITLLPRPCFPGAHEPGTLVVVTDASLSPKAEGTAGDDGLGGFAFMAGEPGLAWVVHDSWPPDVLAALRRSAALRATREPGPTMSMPAAELFAFRAVAARVAQSRTVRAVIAIGDCKPAAAVATTASSKSAVMRGVLLRMHELTDQWLGAHVLRDFNTDADLLSHPSLAHLVVSAIRASGTVVLESGVDSDDWMALSGVIADAASDPGL